MRMHQFSSALDDIDKPVSACAVHYDDLVDGASMLA